MSRTIGGQSEPNGWECNWATLLLLEISTGSWSCKLWSQTLEAVKYGHHEKDCSAVVQQQLLTTYPLFRQSNGKCLKIIYMEEKEKLGHISEE
jgi:hypothetical protein